MRRGLTFGAIATLLLALASVTVAASSSGQSAEEANRANPQSPHLGSDADGRRSVEVIRLSLKEVSSGYLDLGDRDFSLGDQFHFSNDLYRGDTKVGEDGGWCVVVRLTGDGASTVKCVGTNVLREGQITVQGAVTYAPGEEVKQQPYLFPITGGTGKYRTARGEVKIEEASGVVTFRIIR